MGWTVPDTSGIDLRLVTSVSGAKRVALSLPTGAVHLTQGVRRNGIVRGAVRVLSQQGRRWGALMETVDDRGILGWGKRMDYRLALSRLGVRPDFVLAIGMRMPGWVAARGYPAETTFPFAYFLSDPSIRAEWLRRPGPYRVGFAGNLIRRKRLDLLIDALESTRSTEWELNVIGGGPLEEELRQRAESRLGAARVHWLGSLKMADAIREISDLDCLVLPSEHDGWGAVVSEALLAGVPAICSDACGAAVAVHASGFGGTFGSGSWPELRNLLDRVMAAGPTSAGSRRALSEWALCCAAKAGAGYLESVLTAVYENGDRPRPPWHTAPLRLGAQMPNQEEPQGGPVNLGAGGA
jgi:glycosyltransferase involved in cell wall biosynthesis